MYRFHDLDYSYALPSIVLRLSFSQTRCSSSRSPRLWQDKLDHSSCRPPWPWHLEPQVVTTPSNYNHHHYKVGTHSVDRAARAPQPPTSRATKGLEKPIYGHKFCRIWAKKPIFWGWELNFWYQNSRNPPRLLTCNFWSSMGPNGPERQIFRQKCTFWAKLGRFGAKNPKLLGREWKLWYPHIKKTT